MVCDVCGLILNVPLAYVMVFGHLGFPALGIVGAGISTLIATGFAFLLFLFFFFRKAHREEFSGCQGLWRRLGEFFAASFALASLPVSSFFSMWLRSTCSC
jgi:MATE family multidrug resistance protein